MHAEGHRKPLDSFPAIRSRDPLRVESAVIETYGAQKFALRQKTVRFDVRANHWQSQNIALSYCNYGAPVQVTFPGADFYRQQFCLSGQALDKIGRSTQPISLLESPIVPPNTELLTDFGAEFEQIVLRIDAAALKNKLVALTGTTLRQHLTFEP